MHKQVRLRVWAATRRIGQVAMALSLSVGMLVAVSACGGSFVPTWSPTLAPAPSHTVDAAPPDSPYWSDTPRGNTIGNQINSQQGTQLAVADPSGGGFLGTLWGIQRISPSGDVLPNLLRSYGGSSLNLKDGRLYFIFGHSDDPGIGGVSRGIASMKTDGSNLTVLWSGESVSLQVIGGLIYFSCVFEEDGSPGDGDLNNGYVSRLCQMNQDGTGWRVIQDHFSWSGWTVLGDYIYTQFRRDIKEFGLFRFPLSCPSDAPAYEVVLSGVTDVNGFDLTRDGAYVGTDSGLVHVSYDGTRREQLTSGTGVESPLVIGDYVYFVLRIDDNFGDFSGGPIARVPLSGGEMTVIAPDVHDFSTGALVNGWFYGPTGADWCAGDYYGRVRLDGSDLQSLASVLKGAVKPDIRC